MALKYGDRVEETTTTTGTGGTITLAGAAADNQSFLNGIGTGNVTEYTILTGATGWEVNTGTLVDATHITRGATPKASSNSGSLVALVGTSTIFCDVSAETLTSAVGNTFSVENNGTPEAATTLNVSAGFVATTSGGVMTITTVGAQPYDIIAFNPGTLSNSQLLYRAEMVRQVVLPSGLTGSVASCVTPATANATLTIANNGTTIGAINYASAATAGTFTFSTAVTLVAGNVLTVTNQSSADATLANISFTLTGIR